MRKVKLFKLSAFLIWVMMAALLLNGCSKQTEEKSVGEDVVSDDVILTETGGELKRSSQHLKQCRLRCWKMQI